LFKYIEETTEELTEFLEKSVKGDIIEKAEKFTLDSIHNDRLRVIVSSLREPFPKAKGPAGLAEFSIWRVESNLFVENEDSKYPERERVARHLGVNPDALTERKVFVRIHGRTFDITEYVREVSKRVYTRLLEREMRPFRRSEET
jgi:hypothetical protein